MEEINKMIEEERIVQEVKQAKEKKDADEKVVIISGLHSFDGVDNLTRDDEAIYDVVTKFVNLNYNPHDDSQIIIGLVEQIKRFGVLNIKQLEKDLIIKIKELPITAHQVDSDKLRLGQLDAKNQLNGIGKKIYLSFEGNYGYISEGEFKNSYLSGFGRQMWSSGYQRVG